MVFAPPQDLSERHSDAESCSPTRMLHNMEKQVGERDKGMKF